MAQNLAAGSPILSFTTGGTNTGIGSTTHQIFGPYDAASGSIGALYLGAGRKGSNYSSRNDIILYNLSCSPNTKNGTDWNCNVPNIYLNADTTRASADLLVNGNTTVGGHVKVGQTGAACSPALAGAMRFNPSNASMEFCNGSAWGPVTGGSSGLQSYALTNEGTISLGAHSFCALSRVRSGGWGSATAWWCDIQQTAGGTWSLTAHFQRNADAMPGNADCRAICM